MRTYPRWGFRCLAGCLIAVMISTLAARGLAESEVTAEDPDELPEAKQRLREIEKSASQLSRERDAVSRERRPFALRRDEFLGEVMQARQRMTQGRASAVAVERQLLQLDHQMKWATGSELKELRTQQSRLRSTHNTISRKISSDRKLIDDRSSEINALNVQLTSLDQRIFRFDERLGELRRQWLGIRQPFVKYSRGDFEGLRRILDDWLVLDSYWPEAYGWAALCAYELNELEAAVHYLDKAQRLRTEVSQTNRRWPQLEALSALVLAKRPGESFKAKSSLMNAVRLVDRNSDWETYFLLGRYYLEHPADAVRAQSHFQRAIAIHPECNCARLWLARLQTTSSLPEVRNLAAGTTSLEKLWNDTGKQSWRLALFLGEAYSASQRRTDAEAMRRIAIELAPPHHRHRLVASSSQPRDSM